MRCRLPLSVLVLVLAAGCSRGPTRVAVSGTVTFNGAPVDGGRIMFIPEDKASDPLGFANAPIDNGSFALDASHGPSLGKHKVEIVWFKKTGKQIVGSDPPNKVDETIQVIPDTFNQRSTLMEDIQSSMSPLKYDLTGEPAGTKAAVPQRTKRGS